MRLKIEIWLAEQHFSSKIIPIFEESIRAYKASAYKAGLLFSYLGFLSVLKERVNQAQSPEGIDPKKWEEIRDSINNAEQWDASIFQSITRKRQPIFLIPESIVQEVTYWKDRRNDCAHYKHENIDYHHVEGFWSFLQTHLPKFVVNGSKESLLQRMLEHFDYSLTPQGRDISPLVKEIGHVVDNAELPTFFKLLEQALLKEFNDNEICNKIYDSVLSNCRPEIKEELVSFLKKEQDRLLSFLQSYTDKTLHVNLTNKEARRICIKKLFRGFLSDNDSKILASIIQNDIIEEDQREDIFEAIMPYTGYWFFNDQTLAISVGPCQGFRSNCATLKDAAK